MSSRVGHKQANEQTTFSNIFSRKLNGCEEERERESLHSRELLPALLTVEPLLAPLVMPPKLITITVTACKLANGICLALPGRQSRGEISLARTSGSGSSLGSCAVVVVAVVTLAGS